MKANLVTVFMPAYNAEEYIAEAIQSILNQTYENFELLIIDDGSTDKTVDIVRNYKDSRIRLLKNEKNMGLPYTRNRGLEEAKGRYFAIADADDISFPNRLKNQVDFFEKNPDTTVITTPLVRMSHNSNNGVKLNIIEDSEEIKITMIFSNCVWNPSAIIDLSKCRNTKYNSNFYIAQDYAFFAEISKDNIIRSMKDPQVKYRITKNNISSRTKGTFEKDIKRNQTISEIRNDLLDFYGFCLSNEEKEILSKFFIDTKSHHNLDFNQVNILMKKIKQQNIEKNIFDKNKFNNVLDTCIQKNIRRHSGNSVCELFKIFRSLNVKLNNQFYKEVFKVIVFKNI